MKGFLRIFLSVFFCFSILSPASLSLGQKRAPKNKSIPKRKVKLPPLSVKTVPPLEELPPSLPSWWRASFHNFLKKEKRKKSLLKEKEQKKRDKKNQEAQRKMDSISGVEWSNFNREPSSEKKAIFSKDLLLTSFITKKPLKKVGELSSPDSASVFTILFEGQYAYARIYDPNVRINDELNIFRSEKKGLFFYSRHIVEIVGSIKIVTQIKKRMFRVRITKALKPIHIGEGLTHYPLRKIHLSKNQKKRSILKKNGSIFELPLGETSALLKKGSIVFLNKGKKDGVKIGQILAIHEKTQTRKEGFSTKTGPLIGWLQILNAVDKFSTAIITETNQIIYVGDLVGLPHSHFASVKRKRFFSSQKEKEEMKELEEEDSEEEDFEEDFKEAKN